MIYLDNAATTKPDKSVLETYNKVSEDYFFNTASIHQKGRKAENLLEASRSQIVGLMGLKDYKCIFTSGATESNNIAIQSVLKRKKRFGNTVLVSELEHPSVINVLQEEVNEFNVKYIKTTESGHVDTEHLKKLLNDDVVFVTVMAVNNIVGSVQPIEEIKFILNNYPKAHFHVDATQAVGKVNIDYKGVDTLSISGHKFYGVKGVGALFTKEIKNVAPVYFGGGHEENIRSGTVNLPAVAAMAKALRLAVHQREEVFENLLKYNEGVRAAVSQYHSIIVQKNDVPHILNLSYVGAKGEVIVNALSEKEIMVSTTSACASKLHSLNETLLAMGNSPEVIEGSIRISFSKDTTKEDINQLIQALEEVYEEVGDVLV